MHGFSPPEYLRSNQYLSSGNLGSSLFTNVLMLWRNVGCGKCKVQPCSWNQNKAEDFTGVDMFGERLEEVTD